MSHGQENMFCQDCVSADQLMSDAQYLCPPKQSHVINTSARAALESSLPDDLTKLTIYPGSLDSLTNKRNRTLQGALDSESPLSGIKTLFT